LRGAIGREELSLTYQPLFPLNGGESLSCEALLRWHPLDGEPIEPDCFLPRAEESGLIAEIGDWALERACAQAAVWRAAGKPLSIAVNMSMTGMTELALAERVGRALDRHDLPGEALWLEISESAVLRDPERVIPTLQAVKDAGVRIALDEFGRGETRLSLPGVLPLDMVKIDRSLIAGFESDEQRRAIVVAIVALARASGLETVAVGLESQAQLQLACELGCSLGQGFLLSPPATPELLTLRWPRAVRSPARWGHLARLHHRP
jgi:EAL domain-containing protein (putative c-di-GMP-specific phosphodiesterase class I)